MIAPVYSREPGIPEGMTKNYFPIEIYRRITDD